MKPLEAAAPRAYTRENADTRSVPSQELGLLAWDVQRLIRLTLGQTPFDYPLGLIRELDEEFWFAPGGDAPTCRNVAEHAKLIASTDLSYPIILDPDGHVMDGMHRVCKALISGLPTVRAVKLREMPEPDFTGVPAEKLPYAS